MTASLFLSHSSRDRSFCERLARDLVRVDVPVWYDEWEIKVGDSLRQRISSGIESHDFLAVVLSEASIDSTWVQQELNAALDRELSEKKVVVLPVLIEECAIPTFLRDKKYADFRTDYTQGFTDLMEVLGVDQSKAPPMRAEFAGTRPRNDELNISDSEFEDWLLDTLELNNDVRMRRLLRDWLRAGRTITPILPQSRSDYLDLDESGTRLIERFTQAGIVAIRFGKDWLYSQVTDALFEIFLRVNRWGTDDGASVDFNLRPSRARCRVMDSVFVLGATALDAKRFDLLPSLIARTTPNERYWSLRGWFRYTLVMAARTDNTSKWYLPVQRLVELKSERPHLAQDFRDDEHLITRLASFDLLQCLYWAFNNEAGERARASYPSYALANPRNIEETMVDLILRRGPAFLLGDYSDGDLATIIREHLRLVSESSQFRFYWGTGDFEDRRIRDFFEANASTV